MEKGNLNIEKIPTDENYYHSSSDYGYHKAKKEGFKPNTLYSIPSVDGYTSRRWWLGSDKRGVRVIFQPDESGALLVWERPKEKNDMYVIGAIGAIDSENKPSVAQVLNTKTLTQVAELSVTLAPDLFANEITKLSIWYNLARIGFERSAIRHGMSIQRPFINGSPERNIIWIGSLLHRDSTFDKVKNKYTDNYGFELNESTRVIFIDTLRKAIREDKEQNKFKSKGFLAELLIPNFIEEVGKTDKVNRAYAMAICYEMARRYPYTEPPGEPRELPDCSISNM